MHGPNRNDVSRPPDHLADRLRLALGDRYRVEGRIGEGGMAAVFLAEDRKHDRKVAVKVISPELSHTIGIRRFLQEIAVIAQLQHPHLLTLIDSGEVDGLPYHVTPYLPGQSLRELLARDHRLPVERAVIIAREIADGLEFAHEHGIIHRDIKPSNILLSGGHAIVADFGIAAALDKASEGRLTQTGISLGSPTYMSPEQVAGDRDLDAGTDVYSLGCVLYEMICGEPPFEGSSAQQLVARKLAGTYRPVREYRPDVAPALVQVIDRALATDRQARFASAGGFSSALAHAMESSARAAWLAPLRRRRVQLALAGVLAIALATAAWGVNRARTARWVRTEALPSIEQYADSGMWDDAFALALRAQRRAPRDPKLAELWMRFSFPVSIPSDPPGAAVFWRGYSGANNHWEELGTTPIAQAHIPFGFSLLRFERSGYPSLLRAVGYTVEGSQERIPLDTFRLDTDSGLPAGMVRVPNHRPEDTAGASARFRDFFIGRYEVTNREYKRFVDEGGYRRRELWEYPFDADGKTLPWDIAIARFTDRTGRPGPSTWEMGSFPDGQGDHPVGGVSWYEAAAFARFVGRELPTVSHWRHAFDHSTSAWLWRASNVEGRGPAPVGTFKGISWSGAYDMAGNVREWCFNAAGDKRYALGGAWTDEVAFFSRTYLIASSQPPIDRAATNGFRLAITYEDDSVAARLRLPLTETSRVVTNEAPVPDGVFDAYMRMYSYDSTALNPVPEGADTTEHWIRQRVSIDAAYAGERLPVYLYVPRNTRPPYQTIIYYPGANAHFQSSIDQYRNVHIDFVVRSGRAVAFPVYRGMFERRHQGPASGPAEIRERIIRRTNDLRRAIDYLETRDDIDTRAFGYYGYSAGAGLAPIFLVMEPRLRAAVLYMGGFDAVRPPEVEPATFISRVRTPTILLSGDLDFDYVLETSAKPFFRMLGTPREHKKHVVAEGGHFVPRPTLIRETLDWFDRYLPEPSGSNQRR